MNADLVLFLAAAGAEIIEPTSEWEMVRFRAKGQTAVIYRSSKGHVRYSNEVAREAYQAWMGKKSFVATVKVKRVKRAPQIDALVKRDGTGCFFCAVELTDDTMTLEHLVPICHGGNNHISNLTLACEPCNTRAGNLGVVEKVRLREQIRAGGVVSP